MSKGGKIGLVLVSLVAVLAIGSGIASAKTYDFTDVPLLHKAYEGSDPTNKPPLGLEVGTEFSPAEYQSIESSDDDWASYYKHDEYEFHRFKFKIDTSVLTQIDVLHEGYGSNRVVLMGIPFISGTTQIRNGKK